MGAPVSFPTISSEWLKHVNDPQLDFEEITIAAAAGNLPTGTVLGKITASGKYKRHVAGAADGTETAAGILLDGVDASGASDVKAVRVRSNARIAPLALSWDVSVNTAPEKAAALASLAADRIFVANTY